MNVSDGDNTVFYNDSDTDTMDQSSTISKLDVQPIRNHIKPLHDNSGELSDTDINLIRQRNIDKILNCPQAP